MTTHAFNILVALCIRCFLLPVIVTSGLLQILQRVLQRKKAPLHSSKLLLAWQSVLVIALTLLNAYRHVLVAAIDTVLELVTPVLYKEPQAEDIASANPFETKPLRFCCAGGGVFFFWQCGAFRYLQRNLDLQNAHFVGYSAGTLSAALVCCGVDLIRAVHEAWNVALEAKLFEKPLGLLGVWGGLVRLWLDRLLPQDAAELCRGRLYIVATHVPSLRPNLFTNFSTRECLIDCLMTSVHVPFFLDLRPHTQLTGRALSSRFLHPPQLRHVVSAPAGMAAKHISSHTPKHTPKQSPRRSLGPLGLIPPHYMGIPPQLVEGSYQSLADEAATSARARRGSRHDILQHLEQLERGRSDDRVDVGFTDGFGVGNGIENGNGNGIWGVPYGNRNDVENHGNEDGKVVFGEGITRSVSSPGLFAEHSVVNGHAKGTSAESSSTAVRMAGSIHRRHSSDMPCLTQHAGAPRGAPQTGPEGPVSVSSSSQSVRSGSYASSTGKAEPAGGSRQLPQQVPKRPPSSPVWQQKATRVAKAAQQLDAACQSNGMAELPMPKGPEKGLPRAGIPMRGPVGARTAPCEGPAGVTANSSSSNLSECGTDGAISPHDHFGNGAGPQGPPQGPPQGLHEPAAYIIDSTARISSKSRSQPGTGHYAEQAKLQRYIDGHVSVALHGRSAVMKLLGWPEGSYVMVDHLQDDNRGFSVWEFLRLMDLSTVEKMMGAGEKYAARTWGSSD